MSNERTVALVKAGLDLVVAVGLIQLAPNEVTLRVTGAFGFVSSLISYYQVPASNIIVHLLVLLGHLEFPLKLYV